MMPVHKKIFDDLISVENFEDFKKLMIRRKKRLDKEIQLYFVFTLRALQEQAFNNFSQANPDPSQVQQIPP